VEGIASKLINKMDTRYVRSRYIGCFGFFAHTRKYDPQARDSRVSGLHVTSS